MEIGKNFKNINSYNKNMAKSLKDKLFWLDNFKDKKFTLVDFGCADGTLINCLSECTYGNKYIGYDISKTMINLAKSKYNGNNDNKILFTNSWDDVLQELFGIVIPNHNIDKNINILLLSSVIHEVYNYATSGDIDLFWDRVLNTGFDYIIVRDMMVSYDINRKTKETLTPIDIKQVQEFEEIHGSIEENNRNFVHYLLKYRWKINWEREVNENYFPIYVEDFLELMKSYNLDYLKRFRVEFLDKEIKKDFGIELQDYTHIKCIFSKKKFEI